MEKHLFFTYLGRYGVVEIQLYMYIFGEEWVGGGASNHSDSHYTVFNRNNMFKKTTSLEDLWVNELKQYK